jgi:hypothetical protein
LAILVGTSNFMTTRVAVLQQIEPHTEHLNYVGRISRAPHLTCADSRRPKRPRASERHPTVDAQRQQFRVALRDSPHADLVGPVRSALAQRLPCNHGVDANRLAEMRCPRCNSGPSDILAESTAVIAWYQCLNCRSEWSVRVRAGRPTSVIVTHDAGAAWDRSTE